MTRLLTYLGATTAICLLTFWVSAWSQKRAAERRRKYFDDRERARLMAQMALGSNNTTGRHSDGSLKR